MVTLTNAVTRTEESELSRDDLYYLPVGSDFHYWHMHGDPLWSLRSGIETRLKWTKRWGAFGFLAAVLSVLDSCLQAARQLPGKTSRAALWVGRPRCVPVSQVSGNEKHGVHEIPLCGVTGVGKQPTLAVLGMQVP